jgi:hypothetical protein
MGSDDKATCLKVLHEQMNWLLGEAVEYESGRAQAESENAIYADHLSAEMAGKYRRRADHLAIMIAAHEEADASRSPRPGVDLGGVIGRPRIG